MATPDDPKEFNKEVQQTSYQDNDGHVHNVKRVTETRNPNVENNYTHSYQQGRSVERNHQRNLAERDSDNTARGLLLGVLLASLAAIGGGITWYNSQQRNDNITPVVVPVPDQSQPSSSPEARQEPNTQTTIIERTREVPSERTQDVPVPAPIPQQQTPQVQPTAPDTTGSSSVITPTSPTVPQTTSPETQNNTDTTTTPDNSTDTTTTTPNNSTDTPTNSNTNNSGNADQ